jgi:hypothetical protein
MAAARSTRTTPTSTSAARAPRKPADRKPTKADLARAAENDLPSGHDLLRPAIDLRSYEQLDIQASILEVFREAGIDLGDLQQDEDDETAAVVDESPEMIRALAKLSPLLEGFALKAEDFIQWDKGPGAIQRLSELAMWYMTSLSEQDSSAS